MSLRRTCCCHAGTRTLYPMSSKEGEQGSPLVHFTARPFHGPMDGKQAPSRSPIGALGFRMGECSFLCVPVYPTGTQWKEVPLLLGF